MQKAQSSCFHMICAPTRAAESGREPIASLSSIMQAIVMADITSWWKEEQSRFDDSISNLFLAPGDLCAPLTEDVFADTKSPARPPKRDDADELTLPELSPARKVATCSPSRGKRLSLLPDDIEIDQLRGLVEEPQTSNHNKAKRPRLQSPADDPLSDYIIDVRDSRLADVQRSALTAGRSTELSWLYDDATDELTGAICDGVFFGREELYSISTILPHD